MLGVGGGFGGGNKAAGGSRHLVVSAARAVDSAEILEDWSEDEEDLAVAACVEVDLLFSCFSTKKGKDLHSQQQPPLISTNTDMNTMPPHSKRNAFAISLLSLFLSHTAASEGSCQDSDDLAAWETPPPPKSCRLFLAHNGNNDASEIDDRKLGLFTAVDFPRGVPLTPRGGDVVLHLIDVDHDANDSSQLSKWLSHGFLQNAIASGHGGNYEGLGTILTALPGVGMLASSPELSHRPNAWASVPENDEANLPRGISPLAGSFTLHYNLTHVVSNPGGIEKGGGVLVDRDGWYRRKALGNSTTNIRTLAYAH